MNNEELNALKDRAYKWAVGHGFHEEEKSDAYWLGLVMSEAGEAINADRKGLHANTTGAFERDVQSIPFKDCFEFYIKDSVEDEIADIVIRLLDFAGMKGYTLLISGFSKLASNAIIEIFAENGLAGTLFHLNGVLSDSFEYNATKATVGLVINILSDCFDKLTGGSDCDLWWFVKQKMRYNELRPKLNGKLY